GAHGRHRQRDARRLRQGGSDLPRRGLGAGQRRRLPRPSQPVLGQRNRGGQSARGRPLPAARRLGARNGRAPLRGHAALYLSIFGVLLMVAAVSAISARDTSGVGVRAGMILLTAGASLLLPWQLVLPALLACWFGPNAVRSAVDGYELFNTEM